MQKDFKQLKQKLALLREKDKNFKIFGSRKHRYVLQKPLKENQLQDIEHALKVKLPQEYRDFLALVGSGGAGSGGAGPYYGLIDLQENLEDKEIVSLAAKDFWTAPSYDAIMEIYRQDWPETNQNQQNPQKAKLNIKIPNAANAHADVIYFPAPGILPICSEGCAFYTGIVLNGPEQGNMWAYVDVGWIPLNRYNAYSIHNEKGDIIGIKNEQSSGQSFKNYPSYYNYLLSKQNTARIGFYEWYDAWIDYALAEIDGFIYPNEKVGTFKLYDSYEKITSQLKDTFEIIEEQNRIIVKTEDLDFYFEEVLGYRLSRIEAVKNFKGMVCIDKQLLPALHIGADFKNAKNFIRQTTQDNLQQTKSTDLRLKKIKKDFFSLAEYSGLDFEIKDNRIQKIVVYRDKKTEDTKEKARLLEKWLYQLALSNLKSSHFSNSGSVSKTRIEKALYSMTEELYRLKKDKKILQLLKIFRESQLPLNKNAITKNKKASYSSFVSKKIIDFFDHFPAKIWWYNLPPLWQKVFIYTLKIPSEPSEEVLKKMRKLTDLDCRVDDTLKTVSLYDLSPLLEFKNLQKLNCYNTVINDLSPLRKLHKLKVLNCSTTRVSSLKPLIELKALEELTCYSSKISSLIGIESLKNLKKLIFNNTKVRTLKPLKNLLQLEHLECYNTHIKSLQPLQKLTKLEHLNCSNTGVDSLEPIKHLTKLETLHINSTKVTSLKNIASLKNLQSLSLANVNIKDLGPLRPLKKLRTLVIHNTPVTSLKDVWHLPLMELHCLQSNIAKSEIEKFKKDHPSCKINT